MWNFTSTMKDEISIDKNKKSRTLFVLLDDLKFDKPP
jgi:hypothetical protein